MKDSGIARDRVESAAYVKSLELRWPGNQGVRTQKRRSDHKMPCALA